MQREGPPTGMEVFELKGFWSDPWRPIEQWVGGGYEVADAPPTNQRRGPTLKWGPGHAPQVCHRAFPQGRGRLAGVEPGRDQSPAGASPGATGLEPRGPQRGRSGPMRDFEPPDLRMAGFWAPARRGGSFYPRGPQLGPGKKPNRGRGVVL